jgi:hypothetical protein
MEITFAQVFIWILIAALVGELLDRRRAPDGIVGVILVGLLTIFLIVRVFHLHITGELSLDHVHVNSSIVVAALLVAIWSGFAYRRVQPYYVRYYRRGSYVHRPRSRRRWFSCSWWTGQWIPTLTSIPEKEKEMPQCKEDSCIYPCLKPIVRRRMRTKLCLTEGLQLAPGS